jgi:acyl carrier protein
MADAIAAVQEVLAGMRRGSGREVTPDTPFEALGLASLDVVEVVLALERRAGVQIDTESADHVRVVGDLTTLKTL